MDNYYEKKSKLPKGIFWGILLLILIFIASLAVVLYNSYHKTVSSVAGNLDKFRSGVDDLKSFNPSAAEEKFSETQSDLNNLTLGGFIAKLSYLFGGAGRAISGFQGLAAQGIVLSQEVSFFQDNLPDLLINKKGDGLLAHLQSVNSSLKEIGKESDSVSSAASDIESISPAAVDFYIPLKLDIKRISDFLDALIPWLADSPKRVLVLFQNPSEIRPAGGFLGSYADVSINKANLEKIDVRDINDADREFNLKIIPPKPLQAEITSWRAADANWFFDFPASAAQVIKFVEASKLYASTSFSASSNLSVTFDGAIAVSPKILGDILSITGSVDLPDSHISLDKDNFLTTLQRQVQLGQATKATYPKKILQELFSVLFEKILLFDDSQKQALGGLIGGWIENKDLMFYFKNSDLQSFIDYYVASGEVYDLPKDFNGEYLALVDANVGGGKSDIFLKQDVEFTSQINTDGTVSDHLTITREHQGNKSKDWWYRAPNEDYLQIFTSPGSRLVNFSGGVEKKISVPINYSAKGYAADPFVAAVESSTEKVFNYPAVLNYEEFGKNVFATWSKMSVGEKKRIAFDYTHRLSLAPADGVKYQFVFEKQAGTDRNYKFQISAPVGYVFQENNLPVFEYESSDPPGRLMVDLTLEKI
jgi:hypothetical protein